MPLVTHQTVEASAPASMSAQGQDCWRLETKGTPKLPLRCAFQESSSPRGRPQGCPSAPGACPGLATRTGHGRAQPPSRSTSVPPFISANLHLFSPSSLHRPLL